jgi:hypothetical protein
MLALCAVLLVGCGSAQPPQSQPGPPTPVASLGLKYGRVLGQVPFAFLRFSKSAGRDRHPDGDLLLRQAAPVISALGALDTALARGAAPHHIAIDMATLVLADKQLLMDLQYLPGLSGRRLTIWEHQFSIDGGTEQTAYSNVLHDFGLPSVGHPASQTGG